MVPELQDTRSVLVAEGFISIGQVLRLYEFYETRFPTFLPVVSIDMEATNISVNML